MKVPITTSVHVSIIVPSWTGDIRRLRASLDAQTYQDYELIVVQGVSPAGRARNQGVSQARGDIVVFIDDDAYFAHERVLKRLITAIDADPTVGVVGSSKLVPPGATWLQYEIARQVPRWVYPIVDQDTESNPPLDRYGYTGISTTCCAIRREVFEAVGGFDEALLTGPEDTELFYRIRSRGYRFVIPRNCWVYHDPPRSLRDMVKKAFRYGKGHALEAQKAPERRMDIVRLDRWYGKLLVLLSPLLFVPSIFVGLYFDPTRHWQLGFRPLKALSTYATLYGYTRGWFRTTRAEAPLKVTAGASGPVQAEVSASRSSMISGLSVAIVAVLNTLFAVLMAALLPVHAYGVVGLAQSWLLIAATLLNSGFSWELARVLSQHPSLAEAYRAAKSALAGNVFLACCSSLALLVVLTLTHLRFDEYGYTTTLLLIIETVLLALAAVWGGVLQGTLRFGMLAWGRISEVVVKVIVGVALVLMGMGAAGAVGAMVLGTLVLVIISGWSTRHFAFWQDRSWGNWQTYRNSLTLLLGLSALTIISNIDIIGVKLFSPAHQGDTFAGYYQAAVVLARMPLLLSGAYAAALFPFIARLREHEVAGYIQRASKYCVLLIVPISLILSAIPDAMITFIFPATYQTSAQALRILALGTATLSLVTVQLAMLQARGIARLPALWMCVAAIIEIGALWLLVPSLMITGAATALLIAGVVALVGLTIVTMRSYAWRPRVLDALKYTVVNGVFTGVLIWLPHHNPGWTITSIVLALVVYVVLLSVTRLLQATDVDILTSGLKTTAHLDRLRTQCTRAIDRLNRVWFVSGS